MAAFGKNVHFFTRNKLELLPIRVRNGLNVSSIGETGTEISNQLDLQAVIFSLLIIVNDRERL